MKFLDEEMIKGLSQKGVMCIFFNFEIFFFSFVMTINNTKSWSSIGDIDNKLHTYGILFGPYFINLSHAKQHYNKPK